MKYTNIMATMVVLTSISATPWVFAKQSSYSGKKIDIKCHVEMTGGGETIHFANVFKGSIREFSQSLHGQKIWVVGRKGKHEVYKVKQCVPTDKKFKSSRINTLESNTVK